MVQSLNTNCFPFAHSSLPLSVGPAAAPPADKGKKALPSTHADKLAQAVKYKTEGNNFFAAGNYGKAIRRYTWCFAFTGGIAKPSEEVAAYTGGAGADISDEDKKAQEELQQIAHQNIAMCCLKQAASETTKEHKFSRANKAIKHCNFALGIDPKSLKAIYRKAEALLIKNDIDQAKVQIEEAKKLELTAAQLKRVTKLERKILKREKRVQKRTDAKMKKMCGKMFS